MTAAEPVKQTAASADTRLYEPSMEEILASIRRIIADDQSLPGRLSASEEEDRLRAILTPPEAEPSAQDVASAEREPVASVRAIFAPHPVEPEPAKSEAAAPARANPSQAESSPAMSDPRTAVPQHEVPGAPAASASQPAEAPPTIAAADPIILRRALPQTELDVGIAAIPQPAEAQAFASAEMAASPVQASVQGRESEAMTGLSSPGTGQSVTAAFNTLAATRLIDNDEALRDLARDMLRPMLKDWLDENLPVLVERLVRDEIERVGRGGR